jgi:hypothetical protein
LIAAIGVKTDGRGDESVDLLNFFRRPRLRGWLAALLVGARGGTVVVRARPPKILVISPRG